MRRKGIITILFALAIPPLTARAAGSSALSGTYRGPVDGGKGTLTLKESGDSIEVTLVVVGKGCTGQISGKGAKKGDTIALIKKNEFEVGNCTLTLTVAADGITSNEDGCGEHHGGQCNFASYEGKFKKTRK